MSNFAGPIKMKNPSRNRQSQRKTGRKPTSGGQKMNLRSRGMKGAAPDAPKRAAGMRAHGATSAPRSPKKRNKSQHEGGSGWIYGSHACLAALSNPRRTIHEPEKLRHWRDRWRKSQLDAWKQFRCVWKPISPTHF